jgi:hypothetical protein
MFNGAPVIAVLLAAFGAVCLFVAPAGAVAVSGARASVGTPYLSGAVVAPRARQAQRQARRDYLTKTTPKKGPRKKSSKAKTSGGIRLGKRDYAEIALLAVAPFLVVGLFLIGAGRRREQATNPTPKRRLWRGRKSAKPTVDAAPDAVSDGD